MIKRKISERDRQQESRSGFENKMQLPLPDKRLCNYIYWSKKLRMRDRDRLIKAVPRFVLHWLSLNL